VLLVINSEKNILEVLLKKQKEKQKTTKKKEKNSMKLDQKNQKTTLEELGMNSQHYKKLKNRQPQIVQKCFLKK